jgi:thiol-disulfide isomerase/thioredoxin
MPTLSIRAFTPFLLMCCALLLLPFSAQAKEITGKIPNGGTPPAYLGLDRENNKIYATDYAGKVLVVTFWASWCGPCLNELQVLENLQRAAKKSVQVIAINIEEREKFRAVSRALNNLSLMLAHDYTKSVKESYGVNGIPHMVIIGRDGKVVNVHCGYGDSTIPRLVKEINAAITAEPVTENTTNAEAAKN